MRLATADVNVLLHGEVGTGKRLIAESIHAASPRAAAPFVALSLGVRPESQIELELFGAHDDGLLVRAIGGTLYLQEIGALPLRLQRRVARALAASDVRGTIRVIATTTFELEEPLRLGRFLPELYHQLGLIRVTIPPLRERREDLKALSEYFIRGWCERMAVRQPVLSRAAVAELAGYPWPGNVHELQQTIEETLDLARGAELTVDRIRSVLGRRLEATSAARGLSVADARARLHRERARALRLEPESRSAAPRHRSQYAHAEDPGLQARPVRSRLIAPHADRADASSLARAGTHEWLDGDELDRS